MTEENQVSKAPAMKVLSYVFISIAVVGLLIFVINWIRCRNSRQHLGEYDDDEELGDIKQRN